MECVELKSRFKQIRDGQTPDENGNNWAIRVHRSLSWLARAEQLAANADLAEARLLYYWIAFNSLYSRWDEDRNAPAVDSRCMHDFVGDLFQIGAGGQLSSRLDQMKPCIKRLLRNRYLSNVFWRNPEGDEATTLAMEDAGYLEANYREHRYPVIMRNVLDRVYVLRGQIVHGASTSGGKLNRESLKDCVQTMQRLMPSRNCVTHR